MEKIVFNPMEIYYDIKAFAEDKNIDPQSQVYSELLRWAAAAEKLVRPRACLLYTSRCV